MNSIIVFGSEFKIVIKKDFAKQTGYAGLFCPTEKTITIDAGLKGDDLQQTILHEILHAVFYRVGLCQAKISVDAQEMIVENFATAIIENKKFMKNLLK